MPQRMLLPRGLGLAMLLIAAVMLTMPRGAQSQLPHTRVDVSGYSDDCGVHIRHVFDQIRVTWPMGDGEFGRMELHAHAGESLIQAIGTAPQLLALTDPILQNVDPITYLSVGERVAPGGRPPERGIWQVFFDKPANRPYERHASKLAPDLVTVTSEGHRARISIDGLTIGGFAGDLVLTFFEGSRLVQVEAVVSTEQDARAIIYDAGLVGNEAGWQRLAWIDAEGRHQTRAIDEAAADQPLPVRYRTLAAESERGAIALFPPPHQFQFPRDWTDNFGFNWSGTGHLGTTPAWGFGIRQDPTGGRAFVPWFNAPPGKQHRLGAFLLIAKDGARQALDETLRYTHGDRFPAIDGYQTVTSHWHMATAVAAMERQRQGQPPIIPELVGVFKGMGVNAVHLGEFHGDGHQRDPGPLRLPELRAMFDESRRLSDSELLLIPGEELNTHLGIREEGKHPGHWMSLFPRPVYWTVVREEGQPFVEEIAPYGRVYHVGDRADMMELLRREGGLAWAAHPRIKASSWTPDIFRHEDFYLADTWLGGAWKSLPSDLSEPRLGQRALDLLTDMANWGQQKYMPGEVDVFKIDHTHELYSHMNINYVRLDRLPRFDEGWQPVLDALRRGDFWVTTGEVLIRDFSVGGKRNGETLALADGDRPELRLTLDWTFPLKELTVITGDGEREHRQALEVIDTGAFQQKTFATPLDLRGKKWLRVEAWDVATNGAFTQPIWLDGG